MVLDVSERAVPREVGGTEPLGWYVEDVIVAETTAFVAAGGARLYIVDISDPSKLSEQVSPVLPVQPIAYNEDSGRLLASLTMPAQSQVDLAEQCSITVPSQIRPDYAIPFASGSILTVTNNADSSLGTLRWAL